MYIHIFYNFNAQRCIGNNAIPVVEKKKETIDRSITVNSPKQLASLHFFIFF